MRQNVAKRLTVGRSPTNVLAMSNQPPEPAKSYTTRLDPETRDAFEAIIESAKLSEAAGLRLAVLAWIEKVQREGGLKISV
jgi:hypothetical protein